MGSRSAHLQRASENLEAAKHLLTLDDSAALQPTLVQWAITAAFYCSVHCIEAHLDSYGLHSSSHKERRRFMDRVAIPDEPCKAHLLLKDFSEDTRYAMTTFPREWVERVVFGTYRQLA